jgi:hypothetical protein
MTSLFGDFIWWTKELFSGVNSILLILHATRIQKRNKCRPLFHKGPSMNNKLETGSSVFMFYVNSVLWCAGFASNRFSLPFRMVK